MKRIKKEVWNKGGKKKMNELKRWKREERKEGKMKRIKKEVWNEGGKEKNEWIKEMKEGRKEGRKK